MKWNFKEKLKQPCGLAFVSEAHYNGAIYPLFHSSPPAPLLSADISYSLSFDKYPRKNTHGECMFTENVK